MEKAAISNVETAMLSDTARITFSVRSIRQVYGDDRTFYECRIVMRVDGKAVGVEDGPRRTHATARECRTAGYARVRVLKTHRLFVVDVSKKDIGNGEARSCQACAIAQALYRNQERIGLSEWAWRFRVEPYGAFVDCDGIVLEDRSSGFAPNLVTGPRGMPDLVSEGLRGLSVESMYEWALHWDDWADSESMTDDEWDEEHPDDGGKPYRPSPCSFVLNISEMKSTGGAS